MNFSTFPNDNLSLSDSVMPEYYDNRNYLCVVPYDYPNQSHPPADGALILKPVTTFHPELRAPTHGSKAPALTVHCTPHSVDPFPDEKQRPDDTNREVATLSPSVNEPIFRDILEVEKRYKELLADLNPTEFLELLKAWTDVFNGGISSPYAAIGYPSSHKFDEPNSLNDHDRKFILWYLVCDKQGLGMSLAKVDKLHKTMNDVAIEPKTKALLKRVMISHEEILKGWEGQNFA